MKQLLISVAMALLLFCSCRKDDHHLSLTPQDPEAPPSFLRYSGPDYSQHIPIDSAERMVASYTASISSDLSGNIRTLSFNADSMRSFLSNGSIATLKFALAHKRSYINGGNYGKYAGTGILAFTLVLAGLDEEDDDYIYASGNEVYDLETSERLPRDTANHMLLSYLTGIDYLQNNTDLRSLTFDADTMRRFLENQEVKSLQFIIAHRDTYINADNYGQNCGTSAAGLTFVIVGRNSSGQTVYTSNNMVMEHTRPCPTFCTSSNLLTL